MADVPLMLRSGAFFFYCQGEQEIDLVLYLERLTWGCG